MKIKNIEHIGIAVKNLEDSIKIYEKIFGLKCYAVEEVKDQKVKTAFFQVGDTKIELLESTGPDGPIGKFIEKKGEGFHHVALAVDDLTRSLKELESKGIQLIDKKPRQGAEKMEIAFIHPRSANGILIELCSKK